MKPPAFEYRAPQSVDEAVRLLQAHGDEAKLLAGGQSLVPILNMRLARPGVLVDLNRVSGLASIAEDGPWIRIGAMTRHHELATSDIVRQRCPLLAEAASRIGYPAIRNRGTLGGSLAHADPVAELPCIAVTLDAEIEVSGPDGERVVPASDFFQSFLTTALGHDEVLTAVRFPRLAEGGAWGFREFTRKAGDFAVAAVAIDLASRDGVIESARIGLAGVGERPERVTAAERALIGVSITDPGAALREAAEIASATADPASDVHATERFRRQLVVTLAERALQDAVARAGAWR